MKPISVVTRQFYRHGWGNGWIRLVSIFYEREKAARAIPGVKYLVTAGIDKPFIKESSPSTYINAESI